MFSLVSLKQKCIWAVNFRKYEQIGEKSSNLDERQSHFHLKVFWKDQPIQCWKLYGWMHSKLSVRRNVGASAWLTSFRDRVVFLFLSYSDHYSQRRRWIGKVGSPNKRGGYENVLLTCSCLCSLQTSVHPWIRVQRHDLYPASNDTIRMYQLYSYPTWVDLGS